MKYLKTYKIFDKLSIDDILDKISASGYDSLTNKEKELLKNPDNIEPESSVDLDGDLTINGEKLSKRDKITKWTKDTEYEVIEYLFQNFYRIKSGVIEDNIGNRVNIISVTDRVKKYFNTDIKEIDDTVEKWSNGLLTESIKYDKDKIFNNVKLLIESFNIDIHGSITNLSILGHIFSSIKGFHNSNISIKKQINNIDINLLISKLNTLEIKFIEIFDELLSNFLQLKDILLDYNVKSHIEFLNLDCGNTMTLNISNIQGINTSDMKQLITDLEIFSHKIDLNTNIYLGHNCIYFNIIVSDINPWQ